MMNVLAVFDVSFIRIYTVIKHQIKKDEMSQELLVVELCVNCNDKQAHRLVRIAHHHVEYPARFDPSRLKFRKPRKGTKTK